MKRFLASIISLLFTLCIISPTVFAAETLMLSAEYDAVLQRIHDEVSQLPEVNDGQSTIPYNEIKEIISNQENSRITHLETAELASILATYEGLGIYAIAQIGGYGTVAKSEASGRDDHDSYQHTIWNYTAAKDSAIGSNSMRIFACDFEWANRLYNKWTSYQDTRFDYYEELYELEILLGTVSIDDIFNYALADANDYICAYKDGVQNECIANYSYFCQTFDHTNIMDFNNNYVGRTYATSSPTMTNAEMYANAVNSGLIITSASSVSGSTFYSIWQSRSKWAC